MEYSDVLINIRKIIRSINLESKRIEKEHGISIPQYLCLNFLSSKGDYRATAKEIGTHLNLNPSTISGIISRLERKGYLAKLPNTSDKRSTYIYLTAIGEKTVTSIPDLLHEKLTKKLKSLSDKDLNELQSSLALLISFMEVEDVDASPVITPGENIIRK
ncbi:MAG: MarR family winged helix-turn-helix transcriptional regulator [Crocinitomicaceae bacterium]